MRKQNLGQSRAIARRIAARVASLVISKARRLAWRRPVIDLRPLDQRVRESGEW